MRHRVKVKKMNRPADERLALKRSLVSELIDHGSIVTTLPKAKYIRPFAEKMLTLSRSGSLSSHRLVISRLGNKPAEAKKLREHWVPLFQNVAGGYLRIVKLGPRLVDGAEMARIEFVTNLKSQTSNSKAAETEPKKVAASEKETKITGKIAQKKPKKQNKESKDKKSEEGKRK